MVQVDVVNVTALKPGWAMGVRDRWQLRFACPTLSKNFVLCPAAKTITQSPIFFPKTGEISYNNPFAATKAAADK
jgi:hypothetical protein